MDSARRGRWPTRQFPPGEAPQFSERLIEVRRARWFSFIIDRFDLIAVVDLADWIAIVPTSVTRDEVKRRQSLADFETAIMQGEFGSPDKPDVIVLTRPPRGDLPGRITLRPAARYIYACRKHGRELILDMFTTKPLASAFFEAHQLLQPPWLKTSDAKLAAKAAPESSHPPPSKHRTSSKAAAKSRYDSWVKGKPAYPTKVEADAWAKRNYFPTTYIRALHREAGKRQPGRPKSVAKHKRA